MVPYTLQFVHGVEKWIGPVVSRLEYVFPWSCHYLTTKSVSHRLAESLPACLVGHVHADCTNVVGLDATVSIEPFS